RDFHVTGVQTCALPIFGVVNSALILRFTRASMLDVLGEDYVRTARAKGMGEARAVLRHALKNAAIPIITVVGLTFALLVSGAVRSEERRVGKEGRCRLA